MKFAFLSLSLLFSLNAFSTTEFTKKLECEVEVFGIKKITILEDTSDIIGKLRLDIELKNETIESREISSQDYFNISGSKLFIASNGEFHIYLAKRATEYYISIIGDGVNQSHSIPCSRQ
jgi:hypothetical protein